MLDEVIGILQRCLHSLRLFVPALVLGALSLRFGRYMQLRSEGKTSFPSEYPEKAKEKATIYKGLGLIWTGALAVDAWWNYGVIPGVVVTLVFLMEIWIVMGWRSTATLPRDNREEKGSNL